LLSVAFLVGIIMDLISSLLFLQLYYQVLNFGMIVSSALMIWKGLMVITGSESPIVVVLSGSMEPAFHRGDLLFLTNRVEDPIRVGEIVVFRIEGREIPIVHRVLKIHEKQNGHIKFLTKGDNNAVDDRGLYKQGQHWLEKKDVVGRARGLSVPWRNYSPHLPQFSRCC
uniref:Signal peptidase complex catalytic subunit SEC11 n=1 Tax=Equus asinus asinus TaxID=83772 RepID=A0A8C4LJR8_EQUAS